MSRRKIKRKKRSGGKIATAEDLERLSRDPKFIAEVNQVRREMETNPDLEGFCGVSSAFNPPPRPSHEDQMRTLKERMKASRLCVAPDRHEPHLFCGHPLPCPYHTLVMTEDEALDFLEELDQVEGDSE